MKVVYKGEFIKLNTEIEYDMVKINEFCYLKNNFVDGMFHTFNLKKDKSLKRINVSYLKENKKILKDGILKFLEFSGESIQTKSNNCILFEEYAFLPSIKGIEHRYKNNILILKIGFYPKFIEKMKDIKIYVENCYFEILEMFLNDSECNLNIFILKESNSVDIVIRNERFLSRFKVNIE